MDATSKSKRVYERLYLIPLSLSGLLAVFALIAQPDRSLLSGLLRIQLSEAGLITDPFAVGGVGAGLLNAALVLLCATFLVRMLKASFTGVSFACLFMVTGFSMFGINLLNAAPIVLGGWLYSRYQNEPYSKYVYITLFSACMGPMVSFVLTRVDGFYRWPLAAVTGTALGFLLPAVAGYTVRVHQGFNLYNVGFAAGLLLFAVVSICKVCGVEFSTTRTWSQERYGLLVAMLAVLLAGLLAAGITLGCRRRSYFHLMRHSGRTVADFVLLDGPACTLVNMSVMGMLGLGYVLALYPLGVRLSGPLVCCILSMAGFGAFGKHPKNAIWPMAGAVLGGIVLDGMSIHSLASPGNLVAAMLATSLAPIAGHFGWYWGLAAGFIHMGIVQNTGALHEGMNLYNNGFAAGLVCTFLVPIIEALMPDKGE